MACWRGDFNGVGVAPGLAGRSSHYGNVRSWMEGFVMLWLRVGGRRRRRRGGRVGVVDGV